mgnify:CR=1 FL=1
MNKIATIFGTAASGKDTLLAYLDRDPDMARIINITTRPPRSDEINGQNYYFLSDSEHQKNIGLGKYITFATEHGRQYGVLRDSITKIWESDRLPVGHFGMSDHEILWNQQSLGVFAVRSIALVAPSFKIWKERMRVRLNRGVIDEQELQLRLRSARSEIDFILANADKFLPVYSNNETDMQLQARSYLKYSVSTDTDFERVASFKNDLVSYLSGRYEE